MLEFDEEKSDTGAIIKVIGVGGAGGNALNTMIDSTLRGVDFIVVNTDIKDLNKCNAPEKIQIGQALTKGLGTGSDPQLGQRCAMEDKDKLQSLVEGSDMIFITAGLGGGTGTGAAPVVAQLAKDAGALTVAVVTKPFIFEGKPRAANAENGIKELKNVVDALIVVPNQKLLDVVEKNTNIKTAFNKANDILRQGVQSISDLIVGTGLIVVDFNDVKTIMSETGSALMGIGVDTGENRAQRAAEKAISSQLLEETSIQGARGILVNISGNDDITLHEVDDAMTLIRGSADPDANVIFGVLIDDSLDEKIKVTVIATGFDSSRKERVTSMDMGSKSNLNLDDILKNNFEASPSGRRRRSFTKANVNNHSSDNALEEELEIPTFLRTSRRHNGNIVKDSAEESTANE